MTIQELKNIEGGFTLPDISIIAFIEELVDVDINGNGHVGFVLFP